MIFSGPVCVAAATATAALLVSELPAGLVAAGVKIDSPFATPLKLISEVVESLGWRTRVLLS